MVELTLLSPPRCAESASDALMDELGALSVSVEDADAGTDAERALFGEPGLQPPRAAWDRSVLRALFDDAAAATEAATLLLAQDWAGSVHVQAIAPVAEQDWVRLTQAQFAPVAVAPAVAPGFWVVPSWHAPPAGATTVIRLDPGLAFGTGSHPTTRMCLRWIATHAAAAGAEAKEAAAAGRAGGGWHRVLDYGCGSGILAIGAALHGAVDIDAVDVDPAAVEATRSNARANGVALTASLPDAPGRLPAGRGDGGYALVLANILATPLKLLAPLLCARLAAGGDLVLAGILERQAAELRAAYAPWLALTVADGEDGWILMTGRRSR